MPRTIQSPDYIPGQKGWKLDAENNEVEFNKMDVKINAPGGKKIWILGSTDKPAILMHDGTSWRSLWGDPDVDV